MTKDRLRRFFELERERQERGLLDPTDSIGMPRTNEYYDLADEYDNWDPEAVPAGTAEVPSGSDESKELSSVHEAWMAAMDDNTQALQANNKAWSQLCRYWHDRARSLEKLNANQG